MRNQQNGRHRGAAFFIAAGMCLAISAALGHAEDFPTALTHWASYAENPVFAAAGPGHWDARIRERGWILHEGDTYRMWYTGYDGTRPGQKMLGYATSADGLHWTRAGDEPLYREHWVEDMQVLKRGDTYYMFAEGLNDRAHLLTSPDGLHWTRHGPLDVRYVDGRPLSEGPYGTPSVWVEGDVWHLFYERMDLGIWLAVSRDLKTWTNVSDEPVLKPGPDAYDQRAVAFNQIVRHGDRYYALYHGSGQEAPPTWCTCLASSTNLKEWTKYPQNPLLRDNKSSGILVPDGERFRLYTMHDTVQVHFPAADPTVQSDKKVQADQQGQP